jgi:hypothetical protein
MIIGRSPRNPIIGDTVLLRAEKRQGIGTIVDTDAIGTESIGATGQMNFLGMPAPS